MISVACCILRVILDENDDEDDDEKEDGKPYLSSCTCLRMGRCALVGGERRGGGLWVELHGEEEDDDEELEEDVWGQEGEEEEDEEGNGLFEAVDGMELR